MPRAPALLIWVSSIVLLHSAYSAWEARSHSKAVSILITPTHGIALPPDIIIETTISFLLLVVGVAWSSTPLKPISWASEMSKRSIDSEDSRLAFASMRHRGSVLFAHHQD